MNDIAALLVFVGTAVGRVWPAFLISVALGVLIRALKLDGVIRHALNRRVGWAIILATAVGAFSPFCSCTVVPVVSGLLQSGVPLAPVMAFWIASPTMDPEIFALSVATIGWPLALARLGATLLLSLGAGYLTLTLSRVGFLAIGGLRRQPIVSACCTTSPAAPLGSIRLAATGPMLPLQLVTSGGAATVARATACGASSCAVPQQAGLAPGFSTVVTSLQSINWQQAGREMLQQTWSLGRWLLLAFVLEALIVQYIPQAAIAGLLGAQSLFAVPLAALIGIPLYLSNISALPIVSGLLAQGMQPGAAIAFLIAGPVTTIPAMTAVWGVVQRRVFALYLSIGLLGAMLLGLLVNVVL